jgi:phytoene desaturase
MEKEKRAFVVGAGLAGIASAIRLSKAGCRVTVLEQNGYPGGKAAEVTMDGFRFDAGPSLFTLPELVDDLFRLCGKERSDYLPYRRLDNSCKYFWYDGTEITAWSDNDRFAGELLEKRGEPVENTRRFLARCSRLWDLTAEIFIFSPFASMKVLRSEEARRVASNWRDLDAMTTMHKVITRHFRDEKVIQLFDRYATYNGSNPYKAPGTLNVIPHLEHNMGAWYPDRGIYSIVEALVRLAEEEGVEFQYNSRVERIVMERSVVKSVIVDGRELPADIVVSDIDIAALYRKLLGRSVPAWFSVKDRSSSALIFHWGVEGIFPQFDLHNILFSDDYRGEFRALARGEVSDDPTVYLYISSKRVTDDAPEGCENWFVMINVPHDSGQQWDKIIPGARERILGRLAGETGRDISSLIRCEKITGPQDIERITGSWRGSLYGGSSNSMFSAFRRHPNSRKKFGNLYFAGGSVHPGGGIPLCLASAKIVGDIVSDW